MTKVRAIPVYVIPAAVPVHAAIPIMPENIKAILFIINKRTAAFD
ncbi:MAG: hypothetical protein PHZ11_02175 [Desulfitobacteriaceae bacterium]|nr:hypothetical protein [Desulfitobacteriaceae bacterium]MDD4345703.1 hypothetical protein [Desulfitobacteriaceae bacterium]